jgi:hypothetical protein
VYWSARVDDESPPGAVTVTSTGGPVEPGGESAVMVVSVTAMTLVAGTPPKSTAVAPVNPDPVMVTGVSPVVKPVAGLTSLTTGNE